MSKLRNARKLKGMTLTVAAQKTGVDAGSLSRYERGQQTPAPKVAIQLCDFFGLSLDDIYRDSAPVAVPHQERPAS